MSSRNVNGIRNPFSYPPWNANRTFPAMFDTLGADIIIMQELKIQRKDLRDDMVLLDGWDCYFSLPRQKKGYSGVGIYTRNAVCAPIRAEEGLLGVLPNALSGVCYKDMDPETSVGGYLSFDQLDVLPEGVEPAVLDAEGRCVILEFPAFVLIGVYAPANSNGLRDDFRHAFNLALDFRVRNLAALGKNVVLCGDLNVSCGEIDSAGSVEECRKQGISHTDYISTPNRRLFNQLLVGGEVIGVRDEGREEGVLVDTTRAFHPDRKGMYTHWEQKVNARPGNFGSRIDFILVSRSMVEWIKDANIQEGLLGSDHCPVFVDFQDVIPKASLSLTLQEQHSGVDTISLLDVLSAPGTFREGERMKEWRLQDIPAFSGKRMQEFDRRRSIKNMFAAPALKPAKSSQPDAIESDEKSMPPEASDVSVTAPQSPLSKRKPQTNASPLPSKKQKADAGKPAGTSAGRGQQSLKGFFRPRAVPTTSSARNKDGSEADSEAFDIAPENGSGSPPTRKHADVEYQPYAPTFDSAPNVMHNDDTTAASLASRAQTSQNWQSLFSRPIPPLCEDHHEPCKSMQTKKKGTNQGRSFWMCARPLGPSGAKEKGTEWRCGTFIWCSDWKGLSGGTNGGGGVAGGGAGGE